MDDYDFFDFVQTSEIKEEEKKIKSRDIFDVFKSLSQTKEIFPGDEEIYNAFLINRIFAKFPDTLFLANEMNTLSNLTIEQQMDFYKTATVSKSRFAKWFKAPPDVEQVALLMKKLQVSKSEATIYLDLLTEEDRINLNPKIGGIGNKKKNKKTK